jgi:hypothetical protein
MGWRDYLKPEDRGLLSFCHFCPEGEKLTLLELSEPKEKEKVNSFFISNSYNSTPLPLGQKCQKDKRQKPELRLVWKNPFTLGSPEAREESLRVVAEAGAGIESEERSGGSFIDKTDGTDDRGRK